VATDGRTLLEVGRIAKAHGIRGEVIVDPLSNRPGRFAAGAVFVAGATELVVRRAHLHGQRWIVAFDGVETRNQAEALRGQVLRAEPAPSRRGELWVHELVGSAVFDTTGTRLGEVTALEANPASDLLVLDAGPLIPLTFVVESEPGRVVVDPPAGLLEL
jgi:16S rRNA processing protein RimM